MSAGRLKDDQPKPIKRANMNTVPRRMASIDVFRAITMLLMIFVNDLWSLKDIPGWLEHTGANDDSMGLADTVFPAFLFIVGLSIPFAIQARISKGESKSSTALHILLRTLALLVMGVFHVNLEHYNHLALLSKPVYQILITVSFFMVWLDYPATMSKQKRWTWQGIGIALLIALAILYKGGEGDTIIWMRPYWWGILGIIGWSYLLVAGIYLIGNGRLGVLVAALIFFFGFNVANHAGWLDALNPVKPYLWIVTGGSSPALTMAGVIVAVIYRRLSAQGRVQLGWSVLSLLAIFMVLFGFATRSFGGISKIKATPSWTAICTGISIVFFLLLIILVDIKGKKNWFALIKPAGTSTLTCYLLPYIIYALVTLAKISLPFFLLTGIVGLIKSFLFAMIVIILGGLLEKWRLRLKI